MAKAKKQKKSEIQELSEFIRDHMVTKEYLDEKLAPIYTTLENHTLSLTEIREEVRDIRKDIEQLELKIGHIKGYSKDIDMLYGRLESIEKHLGMHSSARR